MNVREPDMYFEEPERVVPEGSVDCRHFGIVTKREHTMLHARAHRDRSFYDKNGNPRR